MRRAVSGRSLGLGRRVALGVVVLTGVAGAVACTPEPPMQTRSGGHTLGVLTTDASPLYRVATAGRTLNVTAPGAATRVRVQEPGNLRMAIVKDTAPTSVDQQSCVTWGAMKGSWDQPGVTLRVRTDATRTRAIMVTNNVMYGARWAFNAHLADSAAEPPLRQLAGFTFPGTMTDAAGRPAPFPWRLCARVQGTTLQVKVWSVANTPVEPAWGTPAHTASTTVPAAWVVAGRPGLYAGHIATGTTIALTDATTATVAAGT